MQSGLYFSYLSKSISKNNCEERQVVSEREQ